MSREKLNSGLEAKRRFSTLDSVASLSTSDHKPTSMTTETSATSKTV